MAERPAHGGYPGSPVVSDEVEVDFPAFDQTTDARRWARAFIKNAYASANPVQFSLDEGNLIGWFANAIERGRNAGAAPFGGEGKAMTGYEVAEAMEQGARLLIRYLSDGDTTWVLAGSRTDDHPDGTPPSWYREHIAQINMIVRDVTGAPEFDGVEMFTPPASDG